MVMWSPLTVIAQANLIRMFSFRVESMNWSIRYVPSGSSAIRRRTSTSTSSTVVRSAPMKASTPTSSITRSIRSMILRTAVIFTLRSASCSLGSRTECCRKVSRSRRRWPSSTILNGLIRRPSSNGVSEPEGMPPGSQAPFSPSWMVAATQATSSPSRKIGMIIDWSVLCTLPNRASLWMKPSPGRTPTVGSSFQYFMM